MVTGALSCYYFITNVFSKCCHHILAHKLLCTNHPSFIPEWNIQKKSTSSCEKPLVKCLIREVSALDHHTAANSFLIPTPFPPLYFLHRTNCSLAVFSS